MSLTIDQQIAQMLQQQMLQQDMTANNLAYQGYQVNNGAKSQIVDSINSSNSASTVLTATQASNLSSSYNAATKVYDLLSTSSVQASSFLNSAAVANFKGSLVTVMSKIDNAMQKSGLSPDTTAEIKGLVQRVQAVKANTATNGENGTKARVLHVISQGVKEVNEQVKVVMNNNTANTLGSSANLGASSTSTNLSDNSDDSNSNDYTFPSDTDTSSASSQAQWDSFVSSLESSGNTLVLIIALLQEYYNTSQNVLLNSTECLTTDNNATSSINTYETAMEELLQYEEGGSSCTAAQAIVDGYNGVATTPDTTDFYNLVVSIVGVSAIQNIMNTDSGNTTQQLTDITSLLDTSFYPTYNTNLLNYLSVVGADTSGYVTLDASSSESDISTDVSLMLEGASTGASVDQTLTTENNTDQTNLDSIEGLLKNYLSVFEQILLKAAGVS